MKIVCLNIWGGKIYSPLIDFIKDQSNTADVFCFQEVFKTTSEVLGSSEFRTNIFDEISLPKDLRNAYPYISTPRGGTKDEEKYIDMLFLAADQYDFKDGTNVNYYVRIPKSEFVSGDLSFPKMGNLNFPPDCHNET